MERVAAVISDDSASLAAIGQELAAGSYRTFLFGGTEGAAMAVQIARPNLVIIDTRTSAVGWDILEGLRRHQRTANVPAILCSANVMALRAGHLRDYLCTVMVKPFDQHELLIVAEELRGRVATERAGSSPSNSTP